MTNAYRISSDNIQSLFTNEIFVFGSNTTGNHGRGAAKTAKNKFGAINGIGNGIQGRSYGIPTKGPLAKETLPIEKIAEYVNQFIYFAKRNNITFLVTEIGCGLAGYTIKDMAPLFKDCLNIPNIYLPKSFVEFLTKN